MSLHHNEQEYFDDFPFEDAATIEKRKQVRKRLEQRLEQKRIRQALSDLEDFEDEFEWPSPKK